MVRLEDAPPLVTVKLPWLKAVDPGSLNFREKFRAPATVTVQLAVYPPSALVAVTAAFPMLTPFTRPVEG
jgi:hypothetical protein